MKPLNGIPQNKGQDHSGQQHLEVFFAKSARQRIRFFRDKTKPKMLCDYQQTVPYLFKAPL